MIDRVVERAFDSEIKVLDSIYDPSNINHIPEEVITMLGGEIFEKYIAGSIDRDSKVAFSQMVSRLYNLKGTMKAFKLALTYLRVPYLEIRVDSLINGCKEITVLLDPEVIHSNSSFNENFIEFRKLENVADLFLPLCARLRYVTNCQGVIDGGLTLGAGMLDYNLILGNNVLSQPLAKFEPSIAKNILFFFCSHNVSDVLLDSITSVELYKTNYTESLVSRFPDYYSVLGYGLILGGGTHSGQFVDLSIRQSMDHYSNFTSPSSIDLTTRILPEGLLILSEGILSGINYPLGGYSNLQAGEMGLGTFELGSSELGGFVSNVQLRVVTTNETDGYADDLLDPVISIDISVIP